MLVSTLSDLVFHVREISSGRTKLLAARRDGRWETLSTADFLRGIHSLAVALEARGLESGDRIAIFSETRAEWHIVDLACQLLGVVTVPLPSHLQRREVGFILRNSGSRWVFYDDGSKRDLLRGLEATLTSPLELVAFDGESAVPGGVSTTKLMGEGAARMGDVPIERFRGRVTEEAPASLLYTSVSGDEPRRALLSHGDAMSALIDLEEDFVLSATDQALSSLSLADPFQRTLDHLCLYRGVAIHYVSRVDEIPDTLRRQQPTLVTAPPELYERAHRRILAWMGRKSQLRRSLSRWAVEAGQRHATAKREGFVGPMLALQRKLADVFVYRDVRKHFGGRLRFAISSGAVATAADDLFRAVGMPLIQRARVLPEADPDSIGVSPPSESEPLP